MPERVLIEYWLSHEEGTAEASVSVLKCGDVGGLGMASARGAVETVKRSMQSLATKNKQARSFTEDRGIMSEVQMIGGALVAIVIIALVLTEVYQAVDIPDTSPFHGIVDSAETTGVAAITLLVVGLLVLSASVIMRFMGGATFGR